jgi:phage shock protein A
MHWFPRMRVFLSANVHTFLDRLEDPERMLTHELREFEERLDSLRQRAAVAIAAQRRLARDLERQRSRADERRRQARLALSHGREDLARWALGQKRHHQAMAQELEAQHHQAEQACNDVRKILQAAEARLTQARCRQAALLARHRAAWVLIEAQRTAGQEGLVVGAFQSELARQEERLAQSTDLLLALVDVHGRQEAEETELAHLEANRQVEEELEAMKREEGAETR